MIEQYLYSRSSNKKQNSQGDIIEEGFGGISKTAGLSLEDIKKLEVFGNDYYPTVVCKNGTRPSVFMKYSLDNRYKDMVLAKTTSIKQPQRMAHVSHQIIVKDEAKKRAVRNLDNIFTLDFIDRNVDDEDIILKQSEHLPLTNASVNTELRPVLSAWNLSSDVFWNIITAVFDCVKYNRKVIFLVDYQNDELWNSIKDILYHIYRFLPPAYREVVGFDSCYSKNSNKTSIHICFADRSETKKISKTLYKLDQKNCLYDYVVDNGEIVHTVDPEKNEVFGSSNIFLKELQLKIGDELLRRNQNRDLDKTFFDIYDTMLEGAVDEIMTSTDSYCAVSLINQINSGRKISREHAFLVVNKYLEINEKSFLIKDDVWISAIQNYFAVYEKDNSDTNLIKMLVKIYTESKGLYNFVFSILKLKLQNDLKSDGIEEIKRYSKCINQIKHKYTSQLISDLFYGDKQISKWYIHYCFIDCDSAKNIMEKTLWIIDEAKKPNTDFLVSVKKEIVTRVQSVNLSPEDVQEVYSVVSKTEDASVKALFTELFEEIMRKINYKEMPCEWFKTLPPKKIYAPRSVESALAYLVGDILKDPSESSLNKYIESYSDIITKKKTPAILLELSEILSNMFLDGRLELNKETFHLSMLSVTSMGFIDVTMLSLITCEFVPQMKDFLLWYSEIYSDYPLPKELMEIPSKKSTKNTSKIRIKADQNKKISIKPSKQTYYMDALLLSIILSLHDNVTTTDAKDISLCAEILMENGLVGEYGEIFIKDFYDHFVLEQKGIKKIYYKLKNNF